MKKQYFLYFFLVNTFLAKSQHTIVPAGETATGAGGTASYTIGQIDYTATADNGYSVSEGVNQPYEISIVTGLADETMQLRYSVYPNPSRGQITLLVNEVRPGDFQYSLSDAQGKLVLQKQITDLSTTIPMDDLPNGSYFIRLFHNSKELKSFKVIKNK